MQRQRDSNQQAASWFHDDEVDGGLKAIGAVGICEK
jgi:hypothetical protein